ncbi:MAG TPA: PQQ-dependent sugar dehydrogenase [Alphaproteobacteria bacterium]
MALSSRTGWKVLLAGAALSVLAMPGPSNAQQPAPGAAPASLPAPTAASVMADRPQSEAAQKLAPVAPPPIAKAADQIPLSKFKVPEGFKLEIYASGMVNARSMARGDKGTLFVGTRLLDKIYAVTDKGGKREVKPLYSGLFRPNGLAFKNGTLYIAELNKISKVEKIEDNLDNPPERVVIYDDLPSDEPHGWKYLAIGPDNKLYFNVGAPCNICQPSDRHAQLRRIGLDGKNPEVIARGTRQVVGLDFHPVLKQLYFSENQRDWLSEDLPNDKLNRVTKIGKEDFGFPRCHQGNVPDPEFGWGRGCEGVTKPLALLGAHTAPLGVRFYTGNMFPKEYQNVLFVARHGSWNKTKKQGGDIVAVTLNENGTVKSWKPFITGFLQRDNNYIGRPVDIMQMPDGALLISDDWNGAVYRLSYSKSQISAR